MFGVAVARLDQVSDAEKERYQALYCGLCRAIKRRYGQISRAALSYDLAFLAMFLDSLAEPEERCGAERCVAHPAKRMPFCESAYSDYAADLSIALAYHKCLDDIADEGSAKARTAEAALRGQYAKARSRIPDECAAIERAMEEIGRLEGSADVPPDACARVFGELMGALFAAGCRWAGEAAAGESAPDDGAAESTAGPIERSSTAAAGAGVAGAARALDAQLAAIGDREDGAACAMPAGVRDWAAAWAPAAGAFGALLGRFIYMMDAAVDFAADERSGSYNPFVRLNAMPQQMREVLAVLAGDMADAFERLPLVQDAHLMRSVLYAGVWQKFNHTYRDELEADRVEGEARA